MARFQSLRDALLALLGGDEAVVVLAHHGVRLLLVAVEHVLLVGRGDDVVLRDRDPGRGREVEAELLEGVEHQCHRGGAVGVDQRGDDVVDVALLQRVVDEVVVLGVVLVLEGGGDRALDAVVEDDPPDGGQEVLVARAPELGVVVQLDDAVLVGELRLLCGAERVRRRPVGVAPVAALHLLVELCELVAGRAVGEVVETEDHVLGRRRQRRAVGRREDVVRGQHQDPGLGLRLRGQRKVHGHLVAVEVGVERVTDQRVDLDRLAFDQNRLEGLNAEAVQRRRAVQQHRVLVDDLLEHVPDLGDHRVDHLLGRLDVLDLLALDEAGHDERLEQLQGHQLRQAALVQAQRRAGHDHRSAGVVHALAEQVLAEAPLLALEHVRERLERAVARPRDGAAAAAVVEQRVDGLLQHALLVVDDDLGGAQVEQALQAVVPVDDAAVEVVEVGGGEAAAVELDHRAQLRRDHRHDVEDHPVGHVVRLQEGVDDLEALDRAGLLLALRGVDGLLEQLGLGLELDLLEQVAHGLGAHAAAEVLAPAERGAEAVLELAEGRLVVDDVLRLHLARRS